MGDLARAMRGAVSDVIAYMDPFNPPDFLWGGDDEDHWPYQTETMETELAGRQDISIRPI